MPRGSLLTAVTLVFMLGLALHAADKPPDDFVKAMKDAAAFAQDMTKPEAEFDFATAKRYVPIVRDAFAVIERYWLDRNQSRAYFKDIALAEEMIKLASDMGVAANLQSAEGVKASVRDLTSRCAVCHDVRREKGPDGFLIKN
jgi:cytochrome c556